VNKTRWQLFESIALRSDFFSAHSSKHTQFLRQAAVSLAINQQGWQPPFLWKKLADPMTGLNVLPCQRPQIHLHEGDSHRRSTPERSVSGK
jgi:hypothetical protein